MDLCIEALHIVRMLMRVIIIISCSRCNVPMEIKNEGHLSFLLLQQNKVKDAAVQGRGSHFSGIKFRKESTTPTSVSENLSEKVVLQHGNANTTGCRGDFEEERSKQNHLSADRHGGLVPRMHHPGKTPQ